jgi:hypothetical protein
MDPPEKPLKPAKPSSSAERDSKKSSLSVITIGNGPPAAVAAAAVAPAPAATLVGAGFMGSVFSPPIPCDNPVIQASIEAQMQTTPLVMKTTDLSFGLTAVRTANYVRRRWTEVSQLKYNSNMTFAVWRLIQLMKRTQPDDFFVLPLSQVCASCPNMDDSRIGIYMKHAGKKWSDVLVSGCALRPQEIQVVGHIIAAVLILHGLGICHNDIHRGNITIDSANVPRLIDWELRSTHSAAETTNGALYIDQLADDRRFVVQGVVHGFFSKRKDLVEQDWHHLARVLERTWPAAELAHHPPKYASLLSKCIQLLRRGTDRDALLAWSLVRDVR